MGIEIYFSILTAAAAFTAAAGAVTAAAGTAIAAG
jgi:hypothetical protein